MLTRSFDTARINEVINHPEVRPHVGDPIYGAIDAAPLVVRPEHWFLMGDHGGFLLSWSAPGIREVHTFVLPEGRGAWAGHARSAMLDFAREGGTQMLWTKIDPKAKHVVRFARQGGMQPTGEVIETFGTPYDIYKLEFN